MEFTIDTGVLKKEVSLVQGICEKKAGIGALASILIEATKTGIQLTATDLDTTVQAQMPAEIKKEGNICVPAKKLYDIVKSLDTGKIKFKKQDNQWVQVTCNGSKFRVTGLAREHFPNIPEITDNEVTIDGDSLRSLISHTCFAVTNEESRFVLRGAKLDVGNGKIAMAATDGHRIAFIEEDIDDIDAQLEVLIPKRALTEVVKFVGNEVIITENPNHIKFESGDRALISRKLVLNFPDYKKVLPKDNSIEVEFDADVMVKSLKRNAIMADERSFAVKIVVEPDKMTLTSASEGESEEIVKCVTRNLPEEGLTFHVNWVYLVEYLNICENPIIKLKDGLSAIEVVDGTSLYICMPLRPGN
jgi:DNA polymerase-3 subunit beta